MPVNGGGDNNTGGHYEYRYGCWVGVNGGHSYCNVMAEKYYGGPAHIEYTEWSSTRFVNTGTMYWMDEDGFGMTSDEEIRLYALIDRHGNFTGPFRVYSVGSKNFLEVTP